jgi:hypothetical protein
MRFALACFLTVATALFGQEKPLVTTYIQGQMGNQMFQVAALLAYGWDHGLEVRFQNLGSYPILHRVNREPPPPGIKCYDFSEEDPWIYSPLPFVEGQNIYLNGFFQSEKYFAKYQKAIRELFAPEPDFIEEIRDKYRDLLKSRTVAIHVRTFIPDGSNPNVEGFRGFTWVYYLYAMSLFPEEDTHFLVFSDQIDWTKRHFPLLHRNVTFIEGNSDIVDFYLMSLCQHQILSPYSSYSWWAAWLNQNPNKIIVAPEGNPHKCKDQFPPSWIRIKKV